MPNLSGDFSGGGESAPFNMAIDTLQRIANIIDKLSAVSSGIFQVENINQVKFNLLTQLFIQCVPLLKEADEADIKAKLKALKAEIKPPKIVHDDSGLIKGRMYIDNPQIEDSINDIEILIQNCLQKEGYFMPPKADPRYSWKRN